MKQQYLVAQYMPDRYTFCIRLFVDAYHVSTQHYTKSIVDAKFGIIIHTFCCFNNKKLK